MSMQSRSSGEVTGDCMLCNAEANAKIKLLHGTVGQCTLCGRQGHLISATMNSGWILRKLQASDYMENGKQSGTHPFRYWIFDNYCEPLAPARMADIMLHRWQVSYDNDVERGKRTSRDWGNMPIEARAAFEMLRAPYTVANFAHLTGIPTLIDDPEAHGAGLHLSVDGSYLQAHLDYEVHPTLQTHERRLNAILFMHHEWDRNWGGELLLCDMNGKAVVEIEPKPGRLALFECGPESMHAVRVISCKQAVRLSCAVYYLAERRSTACRTRAVFLPNRCHGGTPSEVGAKVLVG